MAGGCLAGGCNSGAGVCRDEVPDDEESRGRGYYVGDGRGAYRKVPNYNYVGEGQGRFDLPEERAQPGCRWERCCLFTTAFALFLVALGVMIEKKIGADRMIIMGHPKPTNLAVPMRSAMPAPGPGDFPGGKPWPPPGMPPWSQPATPGSPPWSPPGMSAAMPATAGQRYDCAAEAQPSYLQGLWLLTDRDRDGFVDRGELFAAGQQGRLTMQQLSALRTSDADLNAVLSQPEFVRGIARSYSNEAGSWSHAQRVWCCENRNVGCATTTTAVATTSRKPFDCEAGVSHWQAGWSCEKKASCCRTYSKRFCEVTSDCGGQAEYDCDAGFDNWKQAWSQSKQLYCCEHANRGCMDRKASKPYDCDAGLSHWYRGWSDGKKTWCCLNTGRGCPTTTTPCPPVTTTTRTAMSPAPLFDCDQGDVGGWAREKLDYCCRHGGRGCPTTTARPTPFRPLMRPMTEEPPPTTTPRTTSTTSTVRALCSTLVCPPGFVADGTKADQRCLGDVCVGSEDTATCCRKEIMTCDLNCQDSATDVPLPGVQGGDDGAGGSGLSLEKCQELCLAERSCEAVVFGSRKGVCRGKRDVHTSKCKKGGGLETLILRNRPWGKCVLMGDPHVITFDRPYGPTVDLLRPGEYTLVESRDLTIHGRFGYTRRFPTTSSCIGVAVSGDLLKGHTLVAEFLGPASGHAGIRITLDGSEILSDKGKDRDEYVTKDGLVDARYDLMDPSQFHREARHTIGAPPGALLPSYLFTLGPELRIFVLIGHDNMNTIIEARKTEGLQDGYCGNFNCNPDDDGGPTSLLASKLGTPLAPKSLFRFGSRTPLPEYMTNASGRVHTVSDCPPQLLSEASKRCGVIRDDAEQAACIFDVCAARDANVAGREAALAGLALEVQREIDGHR